MSDFDSNRLKPDSSDRPNAGRHNGSSNVPKISNPLANVKISRQHMMIGIGALILLVIIFTITSSLKNTGTTPPTTASQNIDLTLPPTPQPTQPQEITVSPVSPTPTEADIKPAVPNEQRVEIPGSVVDALPQQSSPAPAASAPSQPPAPAVANTPASLASLPAGNVTLQLSGASRSSSLEAFAKKQNLSSYWIYETRREGKPWFVLIYGSYANVAAANKAIASLPAEVRAKKPWVKPIRQVHQEAKQR